MNSTANALAAIETLIAAQPAAFVASVDADGYPNLKAMLSPRKRDGLKIFYFTTNTSSQRVAQYRQNPKAAIYFCDQPNFRAVMFRGCMEVCEDPATKQLIWREGDTLYYPQGVTDPDYCVLKFTAATARTYANFKSETITIE